VLIAELAATTPGPVLISAPRRRLVQQIAATVRERVGTSRTVGIVSSDARELGADITVSTYEPITLQRVASEVPDPALWICDECHRVARRSTVEAIRDRTLRPRAAVGFSATPYLADDEKGLPLWQGEWYAYDWSDAMRDGVIVPFEIAAPEGGRARLVDACAEWLDSQRGPGVLSAISIAEANALARKLSERGYAVQPIHSQIGRRDQADRIEALRRGDLRALVHVDLLTEGVDLPWLQWIGLTRARGSRVSYAQEIGRVLRAAPGKERAIVWDPHGMTAIHDLGAPAKLGEAMAEDLAEPDQRPSLLTMIIREIEGVPHVVAVFRAMELRISRDRLPLPCEHWSEPDGTITVRVASDQAGLWGDDIVTLGTPYADSPDGEIWLRHPVAEMDAEIEIDRTFVPSQPHETRILDRYVQCRMAGAVPSLGAYLAQHAEEEIESAGGLRYYVRSYSTREQRAWIRAAIDRLIPHCAPGSDLASLVRDARLAGSRSRRGVAVQTMILLRHALKQIDRNDDQ